MTHTNPFAAALQATGGKTSSRNFTEALGGVSSSAIGNTNQTQHPTHPEAPSFSSAFDQFGGTNGPLQNFDAHPQGNDLPFDAFQQQEQLKQQEYALQRAELHKKINPIDAHEVFNAREKETKKQIEQIRQDLRELAKEIKKFHKQIDITLMGNITDTGIEGTGDKSFYDKLRAVINLLIQNYRSAKTWLQQQNSIKKKKSAKRAKGLGKNMAESSGHEQRANMDQFFNSERGDNFGE